MNSINRWSQDDSQSSLILQQIHTASCFLPLLWRARCSEHVCRIYDRRKKIYSAFSLSCMMEFTVLPKGTLERLILLHAWSRNALPQRRVLLPSHTITVCYWRFSPFLYKALKPALPSTHFSTHRRLSWAPPGGEWRGCPSAAPSTSWPPRSVDSLRCSGRWWPLCGRPRRRSSGGRWCCLPWFSARTKTWGVNNGKSLDAALFQRSAFSLWPWWRRIRLRCLWWWAPEHPPSSSPPPPSSRLWRERRWSLPVRFGPPAVSACPLYESWACRTGSKYSGRDVKVYTVSTQHFILSYQNGHCKKKKNNI